MAVRKTIVHQNVVRSHVDKRDDGEAQRREQEEFFALAKRFRATSDPKEVTRLGDQLGRMIFD